MSQLFLTQSAQDDLDQIWFYIAQDDPRAANQFLDDLSLDVIPRSINHCWANVARSWAQRFAASASDNM